MIGSLNIKKLNLELPIYLGSTKANLYKGAAHLANTSFPLGEKSSNNVIAAHRGLIRNQMFRHIDRLKKGDEVVINTFWNTLKYRVCEIEIINPLESSRLRIQENRDLVTLVTCHPYRVNNQRYVVYCERIG